MNWHLSSWLCAVLAFLSPVIHGAALDQEVFQVGPASSKVSGPRPTKSIAIVGAGSAGLGALKALLDLPLELREGWDIVLYEQRRNVGGIWLSDLHDPQPPKLPETPLYPSLKTNTPHPSMTYKNFPFPPKTPVFPTHDYVKRYHYDFATTFDLFRYIHFNTTVHRSAWIGNSTVGTWNVTIVERNTGVRSHRLFDHLIVANGHYHYPNIPSWSGQDDWLRANPDREILHSIYWRKGTKYAGKYVVVVGGQGSAMDMTLHTAPFAEQIYLSTRSGDPPNRLKAPYILKPGISHFTKQSVVFADGTEVSDVDSVLLGTGYELRAPFLTEGGVLDASPGANTSEDHPFHLTTNLRYIYPLYKHVFSLAEAYPPTALSFVGLNVFVQNCPTDYAQSFVIAHALANPDILPSRPEMLESLRGREEYYRERGYDPYRAGHHIEDVDGHGNASYVYEEGLIDFLKERHAIPDDGKPYVDPWRRINRTEFETLWRAWRRVESLGARAVDHWLEGVETEDQWGDLLWRLVDWERQKEREDDDTVTMSSEFLVVSVNRG